jgi:hypothetical protein
MEVHPSCMVKYVEKHSLISGLYMYTIIRVYGSLESALLGTFSALVNRRHSPISANNRQSLPTLDLLVMVTKIASISPSSDTRKYKTKLFI